MLLVSNVELVQINWKFASTTQKFERKKKFFITWKQLRSKNDAMMHSHISSSPKVNILVYNDEGCLPTTVNKIVHTLREIVGHHYAVQKV